MRATFSQLLVGAAKANPSIMLLTGDHGYALFDAFRKECPEQYINCGVAEQNMIGIAAGLAKTGFFPIVYGLSAFVPMRVLEQIKIDLCYEPLPALLVGDGAGVVYSHLGASHQSTEDVAALRALPNIDIASPADKFELSYCFSELLKGKKPGYLRFGKADRGDVHNTVPTAQKGRLLELRESTRGVAIIATGALVTSAINISDALGDIAVYSAPFITPVNREQLLAIGQQHSLIITIEEHSVHGGLGGLVSEIISETASSRVFRLGIKNQFSLLCGTYDYLLDQHGISIGKMTQTIQNILSQNPDSGIKNRVANQ